MIRALIGTSVLMSALIGCLALPAFAADEHGGETGGFLPRVGGVANAGRDPG